MAFTDATGTFSAWVYPDQLILQGGDADLVLYIDWYTSGDAFISRSSGSTIDLTAYSDWTQFSVSDSAPGTTAKAICGMSWYFQWFIEPPEEQDYIYLDDLSFPSPTIVEPSFEHKILVGSTTIAHGNEEIYDFGRLASHGLWQCSAGDIVKLNITQTSSGAGDLDLAGALIEIVRLGR
jgi:hypothetical protein